jgi:hypothetical protein
MSGEVGRGMEDAVKTPSEDLTQIARTEESEIEDMREKFRLKAKKDLLKQASERNKDALRRLGEE